MTPEARRARDPIEQAPSSATVPASRSTKEKDRLAHLVHRASDQALEDLGLYDTEPIAKMLGKSRPDLAARRREMETA